MALFFNNNLKHVRKMLNVSQQELADQINMDRSTISRWENNEMEATLDNAIQVANAFNISIADFIARDLTKLSTDSLLKLSSGCSYNEAIENQKNIDLNSELNYYDFDDQTYIDIDKNDYEEQDRKRIKVILKEKNILKKNDNFTEEDYDRLIQFIKANKDFIIKKDK